MGEAFSFTLLDALVLHSYFGHSLISICVFLGASVSWRVLDGIALRVLFHEEDSNYTNVSG